MCNARRPRAGKRPSAACWRLGCCAGLAAGIVPSGRLLPRAGRPAVTRRRDVRRPSGTRRRRSRRRPRPPVPAAAALRGPARRRRDHRRGSAPSAAAPGGAAFPHRPGEPLGGGQQAPPALPRGLRPGRSRPAGGAPGRLRRSGAAEQHDGGCGGADVRGGGGGRRRPDAGQRIPFLRDPDGDVRRLCEPRGQADADTASARPGYSEHQTGWAFDIGDGGGACSFQPCFAEQPAAVWAQDNAHRFGFVVRYRRCCRTYRVLLRAVAPALHRGRGWPRTW